MILHIGLHKTATTSLQVDTFPKLRGVCYLGPGEPEVKRYVNEVISVEPMYRDHTDAAAANLRQRLSLSEVNLISSEALSGPAWVGVSQRGIDHRQSVITNLQRDFPNAYILLILRRQDQYARSIYRQYVKTGGTASMRKFFGLQTGSNDPADNPPLFSRHRFEYSPFVRELQRSFPGRVKVIPFELMQQDTTQFLKRVCQAIGTEAPSSPPSRLNRTRLGSTGLHVSRMLNRLFRSQLNPGGFLPGIPVRLRGRWLWINPVQLLQDYWPFGQAHQSAEERDLCTLILRRSAQDNRKLAAIINEDLHQFGYWK